MVAGPVLEAQGVVQAPHIHMLTMEAQEVHMAEAAEPLGIPEVMDKVPVPEDQAQYEYYGAVELFRQVYRSLTEA